ncbi:hypothetical protein DPMN_005456 [Dreissena polymorpha]|uniref:VWFD domain-containing protein n=2 Tax=Dreissena polymorpha TaxID=45954 RepID=A0A9D4MSQ9_DREPO|nr:hypothetical protein DPMN_005456 [Dreissena polymorpha]
MDNNNNNNELVVINSHIFNKRWTYNIMVVVHTPVSFHTNNNNNTAVVAVNSNRVVVNSDLLVAIKYYSFNTIYNNCFVVNYSSTYNKSIYTWVELHDKLCTQYIDDNKSSIKSIDILPTLSYREQLDETTSGAITYTPYIVFKCHFILDGSFFYFIDWYVNGVAYKTFGPSRNLDELVLTDTYLENDKISPGIDIYCGVRVASDETGRTTPSFNSTVFFAGLKIVGNRTSLSQDTEASVRLMSTVPIGCKYNSHAPNTDCFLDLQIYDPAGYKCNQGNIVQLKVMPDSQFCGQKIKGLKRGDFWNISAIYEVKIQTVDETRNDKSRYSLHMLTATDFGHRWFSNYKLGAVDVDVQKDNTYSRVCYSHVDPHMKTADGQYYENQEDGEYLLYKNVKYGIEVQEKYKRCNNNYALCTCGIAIKAGADVFMINTCGTAVFTGFVSCRDGGILKIVNQGTRQFYVYTPIGTWIDIYMHGSSYINTMNVDIYMAPKDKKQTEGLCGYFDGNNANDFRTRNGTTISASSYPYAFTRSWRLNDDENLFKTVRPPLRKWSETNGMYCVCDPPSTRNTSRGVCAETQYMRCPRYEATTQKYCRFSGNRKKRSTVMKEERELLRLLALTKQSKEVHDLKKRSEMSVNGSSIDVEVARRHCTAAINGSVAVSNNAESLGGESPDEVINQCMFDVQAGDDLSLAQVHIDSLNGLVEKELAKDPEYVANNADKVQTFIKNSCPSNCSGQGVCSDEGTCICSKYTHGSDCSIDERVALIIDDIEGGGLCNLTDGDGCTCFYVRTMNLLQNFSCQINTKVGLTDGTILDKTPVHLSGEYDDMFTGVCCVQASEDPSRERRSVAESLLFWKKYDIAISNDGTNFGSPVSMIVFDSVCQEVLDLGEVTLKDDFCFIDGTCVASYGSHISDECYQCEPSIDKYAWTQVCEPEKPQNQTAVIISVVVGFVLAVALIISGIVIWKLKIQPRMKKTRSVNVSQQFHSENMN